MLRAAPMAAAGFFIYFTPALLPMHVIRPDYTIIDHSPGVRDFCTMSTRPARVPAALQARSWRIVHLWNDDIGATDRFFSGHQFVRQGDRGRN